jgi:hypothetical protein
MELGKDKTGVLHQPAHLGSPATLTGMCHAQAPLGVWGRGGRAPPALRSCLLCTRASACGGAPAHSSLTSCILPPQRQHNLLALPLWGPPS